MASSVKPPSNSQHQPSMNGESSLDKKMDKKTATPSEVSLKPGVSNVVKETKSISVMEAGAAIVKQRGSKIKGKIRPQSQYEGPQILKQNIGPFNGGAGMETLQQIPPETLKEEKHQPLRGQSLPRLPSMETGPIYEEPEGAGCSNLPPGGIVANWRDYIVKNDTTDICDWDSEE